MVWSCNFTQWFIPVHFSTAICWIDWPSLRLAGVSFKENFVMRNEQFFHNWAVPQSEIYGEKSVLTKFTIPTSEFWSNQSSLYWHLVSISWCEIIFSYIFCIFLNIWIFEHQPWNISHWFYPSKNFHLNQIDCVGATSASKLKIWIFCSHLEEETSNLKCLYDRKTFYCASLMLSGTPLREQ